MIKRVYKGKNAREGSACAYKCLTYILGFAYAWALQLTKKIKKGDDKDV